MNSADQPPLSRYAFDRAAHRRTDEAWLAAAWPQSRVVAVSPKSTMPTDGSGRLAVRDPKTVDPEAPRRFLGVIDGVAFFAATVEPDHDDTWQTLREFGAVADDLGAALVTSAIALEQWHQRHTHCPLCGAPTVETHAGWTRTCTVDASQHFPRTDPAVIMLVHDGGERTLLGRGHEWNAGRFSTLAGFVEPGESLADAVRREVREETGIEVVDCDFHSSQPWPFPASLMLGFTATAAGRDIRLADGELEDARWFTAPDIVAGLREGSLRASTTFSISYRLLEHWLRTHAGIELSELPRAD